MPSADRYLAALEGPTETSGSFVGSPRSPAINEQSDDLLSKIKLIGPLNGAHARTPLDAVASKPHPPHFLVPDRVATYVKFLEAHPARYGPAFAIFDPKHDWNSGDFPLNLCEFLAYKTALAYYGDTRIRENLLNEHPAGISDYAFFNSRNTNGDTQAFAFVLDGAAYVIFRGTEFFTLADWATDFDTKLTTGLPQDRYSTEQDLIGPREPGRHTGFAIAWGHVRGRNRNLGKERVSASQSGTPHIFRSLPGRCPGDHCRSPFREITKPSLRDRCRGGIWRADGRWQGLSGRIRRDLEAQTTHDPRFSYARSRNTSDLGTDDLPPCRPRMASQAAPGFLAVAYVLLHTTLESEGRSRQKVGSEATEARDKPCCIRHAELARRACVESIMVLGQASAARPGGPQRQQQLRALSDGAILPGTAQGATHHLRRSLRATARSSCLTCAAATAICSALQKKGPIKVKSQSDEEWLAKQFEHFIV